jgi:MFS family permease
VRRLLLLVGAIVFVDTMFYAVVAPLLPHYADELNLSKASAGILLAAYPAGTLVGALPTGVLAARVGAKRAVLAGLMLLAASSIGFAAFHDEVLLDVTRFIQGLGGACSWAGGMAWLIEAAPPERRGELIGTTLASAIGGSLLGPAIGAVAIGVGTAPVFGTVGVIAVGLALWAAATPGGGRSQVSGAPVGTALRAPLVIVGMWLVALPAFGFGVLDVLAPLQMDDLGAAGAAVAAAFLVAAAVEAMVSPIVGRLSDRRGRAVPIRIGLAASTALVLLVPVAGTALLTAALLVATTAALGFFWAPAMALLSDAAEAVGVHQGLAFGLVNLAWASGMVIGAAGGGALAKATTDAAPFALVSALCVVTLIAAIRNSTRTIDAVGRR